MFFDADPTYVICATHVVSVEDLTQRSIVFRRLEICHCSTQREAPKTYIYIYIILYSNTHTANNILLLRKPNIAT